MKGIALAAVVLTLATASWTQDGFTIDGSGKSRLAAAEAQKIYDAACAAVEREFSLHRSVRPQFRLVVGAAKNSVDFDHREINLTKWNRYLFAQGVVMLAIQDLMSPNQKAEIATRAVNWANSTIDVQQLKK